MSAFLPFIPSVPNYDFSVSLNDIQYSFDVHWNQSDNCWYFDMYDQDQKLMVAGVKIVLGTFLGRKSSHPFFAENIIWAIETTGSNLDATFDDLGRRVIVEHLTLSEYLTTVNNFLGGANG